MSGRDDPTPSPDGPDADRAYLIHWLADRDTPCPQCGYNLRGLTRPNCPECNKGLELRVALSDPFMAAWIATVAAVLPGAGIGLIFSFSFLYALAYEGTTMLRHLGDIPVAAAIPLLFCIGSVPTSVLLIALRRRFLRLAVATQKSIATFAWLLAVSSIVCVLKQVTR